MDFFSLCEQNDQPLKKKYDELISGSAEPAMVLIGAFCQKVVDEGVISKNMKPMDLRSFFEDGKLLNIYEWAAEISKHSKTKVVDQIVAERLDEYFEKRKKFDEFFPEFDKPNYGALNIGNGLGAISYGEYCITFQPNKLRDLGKLGYLSADSLNMFVSETLEVDVDGIKINCSTDQSKQFLAALKHSDDILEKESKLWAETLCGENAYIEAIFPNKVEPQHIYSVRISKIDYDIYWDYAFEEFREKLDELQRYKVNDFRKITDYLREHNLDWEVIISD